MKAKQYQNQLSTLNNQASDLSMEQSILQQMEGQKSKLHNMKNDPTITSFSENQISTGSFSKKIIKSSKHTNDTELNEFHHKKSRKSNKKKIIEKNIILTSRDRHGKSSRILKNQEALKLKLKLQKAEKLKSATKLPKIKQNMLSDAPKPTQIKTKVSIIAKVDKKLQRMKLDQSANIKMWGFERRQLQKKRDDLLKRAVEDWNFIQKVRSDKRQLRVLNIC